MVVEALQGDASASDLVPPIAAEAAAQPAASRPGNSGAADEYTPARLVDDVDSLDKVLPYGEISRRGGSRRRARGGAEPGYKVPIVAPSRAPVPSRAPAATDADSPSGGKSDVEVEDEMDSVLRAHQHAAQQAREQHDQAHAEIVSDALARHHSGEPIPDIPVVRSVTESIEGSPEDAEAQATPVATSPSSALTYVDADVGPGGLDSEGFETIVQGAVILPIPSPSVTEEKVQTPSEAPAPSAPSAPASEAPVAPSSSAAPPPPAPSPSPYPTTASIEPTMKPASESVEPPKAKGLNGVTAGDDGSEAPVSPEEHAKRVAAKRAAIKAALAED